MKQIKLTQNQIAIVDDEDFNELSRFKWYALRGYSTFYALRYYKINEKWLAMGMHRQIMNAQKGQQVDHKNRNGLDNRRCNLRFCDFSQNQQNKKPQRGGTSKLKGVMWCKAKNKWRSMIQLNGEKYHLGRFNTEIEAAKVYDAKAKELFGEFAGTNFE